LGTSPPQRIEGVLTKYQIERILKIISLGSASVTGTHCIYCKIEDGRFLAEHFVYRVPKLGFIFHANDVTIGRNRHGGYYRPRNNTEIRLAPEPEEIVQTTKSHVN
jgi:hypothetical protein